jgi:hypothetical protein
MLRLRPSVLLLVALAAVALAGCGNKESKVLEGAGEGSYLDVGELKYQVQISRLLNPRAREDSSFLVDLPAGQTLGSGDQWFAVFMRVQNETKEALPMAQRFQIEDTQGHIFRPVTMGPRNVFSYRPGRLESEQIYPLSNTVASEGTIQGSMLLFKIPNEDLENRPLELTIRSPRPPGEIGETALDV